MKKLLCLLPLLALLAIVSGQAGAQKTAKPNPKPTPVPVRVHNLPVHWFLDANTSNPAAFVDFYNGKAYTQEAALGHAASIDAFLAEENFIFSRRGAESRSER